MTDAEMHPIEVQDTPVLLERALTPRFKLLGERLVQAADRARTGSNTHQGLGHFPDLVGACPGDKHLGEPFGNMGFIATVAFKSLRMELTFTISGDLDFLEPTSGGHQIARVGAVAVPFALRATLSPGCSNERI